MYRAQFAFNSSEPGVLPCAVGDQFTVVDSSHEQWWLVQNGQGQVGYVPANYIVADDVSTVNATTNTLLLLVITVRLFVSVCYY